MSDQVRIHDFEPDGFRALVEAARERGESALPGTTVDVINEMDGLLISHRAILWGELEGAVKEFRGVAQARKQAWIDRARKEFAPGPAEPCWVCDHYQSITQAHHVFPLAVQYDLDLDCPDHRSVWLCPNHHVAVHKVIDGALRETQVTFAEFDRDEMEAVDRVAMMFVNAYLAARRQR